jgi:antitoxin component YwqK of YwqJK toxin-antitoxin module
MKKIFATLFASAFSIAMFAQQTAVEYWPNGTKKSEGVMLNAQAVNATDSKAVQAQKMQNAAKDGKWSYWFENGQLSSEEHYSSGAMIGTWKSWYNNGQISSQIDFSNSNAAFYHANGQKESEGKMYSGMKKDGKWTGWYDNGKMNYEGMYSDGKKTGTWIYYSETGAKTAEQVFNAGELVSTKKF